MINLSLFLIWNVSVMLMYGFDKIKAKSNRRRISEVTLLTSAFLLGGCGAMLGMVLFNHKTSKLRFRILVPIANMFTLIIIFWLKINI